MSAVDIRTTLRTYREILHGRRDLPLLDRDLQVGDELLLREWREDEFTGRSRRMYVSEIRACSVTVCTESEWRKSKRTVRTAAYVLDHLFHKPATRPPPDPRSQKARESGTASSRTAAVRRLCSLGYTQQRVAEVFGVTQARVNQIVKGRQR